MWQQNAHGSTGPDHNRTAPLQYCTDPRREHMPHAWTGVTQVISWCNHTSHRTRPQRTCHWRHYTSLILRSAIRWAATWVSLSREGTSIAKRPDRRPVDKPQSNILIYDVGRWSFEHHSSKLTFQHSTPPTGTCQSTAAIALQYWAYYPACPPSHWGRRGSRGQSRAFLKPNIYTRRLWIYTQHSLTRAKRGGGASVYVTLKAAG